MRGKRVHNIPFGVGYHQVLVEEKTFSGDILHGG